MIVMKTVKTMGELRQHLADVPDETPLVQAEYAMAELFMLECGTLRLSGVDHVAFLGSENWPGEKWPG
jgi:hypothetical protein